MVPTITHLKISTNGSMNLVHTIDFSFFSLTNLYSQLIAISNDCSGIHEIQLKTINLNSIVIWFYLRHSISFDAK